MLYVVTSRGIIHNFEYANENQRTHSTYLVIVVSVLCKHCARFTPLLLKKCGYYQI